MASGTPPQDKLEEVLIVDDVEHVRAALQRSLTRLGYEVLAASDGVKALAMALDARPLVILADIQMPGIDGHTLLRKLAARGSESLVVIMSAHGDMDDVIDVMRNGAVDYLKEPWTPSELLAVVARAVELAQARAGGPPPRAVPDAPTPAPAVPSGPPPTALAAPPRHACDTVDGRSDAVSELLERLRRGEIILP